jgi:hypothetical protein
MKSSLFAILLLLIAACAPPLPAGDMMPMTHVYDQIPANPALTRRVKLGTVTVAKGVGGGTAPVEPTIYREAIQNALLTSNFAVRAGDSEHYVLDSQLLELDVPMFGFSMSASAKARYRLKSAESGSVLFDQTLNLPYTAEFSEALDGGQRARLASAKAIRENITHLIRVLAALDPAQLQPVPTDSP